jgi:hypothetical protein
MKYIYFAFCLLLSVTAVICAPSCETPISINDFHASPSAVIEGQASTLVWDTAGVSRASLNNGIGEVVPAGTAIVTPSTTTKYVLTITSGSQQLTREITVTVTPETTGSQQQAPAASTNTGTAQGNSGGWVPVSLRYDNLNVSGDNYLSDQIAVWHTYAKLAGASTSLTAMYSNSTRGGTLVTNEAGVPVKSPLIILPSNKGMVCIIKNYSQISYKYFGLVTSWYGDSMSEAEHLAQKGYGLATVFSPEKTPFKIQKINMAAVANHTGAAEEYEQYQFIVRILDDKNNVIWTKALPWSYFKNPEAGAVPAAIWKSIAVDDVVVKGDFTVEVLSESTGFETGRSKASHYLALAYERISDKDANTRSLISENGIKADSWIRMYDNFGHPISFNLCIRVEGGYSQNN